MAEKFIIVFCVYALLPMLNTPYLRGMEPLIFADLGFFYELTIFIGLMYYINQYKLIIIFADLGFFCKPT